MFKWMNLFCHQGIRSFTTVIYRNIVRSEKLGVHGLSTLPAFLARALPLMNQEKFLLKDESDSP